MSDTIIPIRPTIPPFVVSRNGFGLIENAPSINYAFSENGLVDWRKMINPKFLVPNKQKTKETDISKLEDKDILILLGGVKELAQIRGYTSVEYRVTTFSSDAVTAVCSIRFIPNYETEQREVLFSAIGDATFSNTTSFGRNFLGPIAENRAFVRCVRNFLRINIVGSDELGGDAAPAAPEQAGDKPAADGSPVSLLTTEMDKRGLKFANIITRLREENYEGAAALTSLNDLPGIKVLELIGRIKKIPVKS